MTVNQLLAVLIGRRWLLIGTLLVTTALALGASLVLPKSYSATASVLVDARGVSAVNANNQVEVSQQSNQQVMATQTDLVTSERVARRVVELLKLRADPAWHQRWLTEGEGQGDETSFIALQLLKKIEVRPSRDSNVLSIVATFDTPQNAMNIANTIARASIETNLELKVEPARQFAGWFDDRIKALRQNLETAQEKLATYQRENSLLVGGNAGQIDVENARLAQLAAQLVDLQAARSESSSRQAQATGNMRASQDVIKDGVIAGLRASIATAEANLKQISAQFGERHPQVVSAREQLDALRAQLGREMQSVANSTVSANAVNEQRVSETRTALAAQKARVLELMNASNEAAVLQRDVDSARRALEVATTRQSQMALESQMQQTNMYVLTSATEPSLPSRPRLLLNTAVGAVFGLLLGATIALWRESRSPIVRSVDDLSLVLPLPVLATIPRTALSAPVLGRRRQRKLLARADLRKPSWT